MATPESEESYVRQRGEKTPYDCGGTGWVGDEECLGCSNSKCPYNQD